VKAKRLRVLLKEANSIARGWYFNYANHLKSSEDACSELHEIAHFQCPIRERPELGMQNKNRLSNMYLCSSTFDMLMLRSAQVFSLQKLIGEATQERGFKSGPVLMRGRLSEAPGGGLCQVSTVLFNVALLANLEILEKHNHSVDIWGDKRIADLGRDAAYVYARKDLKFRNSLGRDVVLRMGVVHHGETASLEATLLSKEPLPYEVNVTTSITSINGPVETSEASMLKGYRAETIREVTVDDRCLITYRKRETYRVRPAG
jgi:vancomycin resistance protein VanW